MLTQEQYWEALKARVCVKCVDGDGKGGCHISGNEECSLKARFPEILQVINSVYSPSIEPYEEQLRAKICASCKNQSSSGTCTVRDNVECALDRYFPLIVQVIEETQLHARLAH